MPAEKKKLIINYSSLPAELLEAVRKKYPLGWINHTIKVKSGADNYFFAITLDTDEASYLIKVPVKIDTKSDKDDDDLLADSHELKDQDEAMGEEEEKEADHEEDRDE